MKIAHNQKRLGAYLTAGLGVGCVTSQVEAVITLDPSGDGLNNVTLMNGGSFYLKQYGMDYNGFYFQRTTGAFAYTQGTQGYYQSFQAVSNPDTSSLSFSYYFDYNYNLPTGVFQFGAVDGDDNFVFFDQENDGFYETLLRFDLDAFGNGVLVGAAVESDIETNINFNAGVTALGGTPAIPEPSQHVALLGLGAAGLIARRRNKKAA